MKIYGCKVKSYIDGGAPGYFIIGPFVSAEDAEKCASQFNTFLSKNREDFKDKFYDLQRYHMITTVGYDEGIDSQATVIEIPIYDSGEFTGLKNKMDDLEERYKRISEIEAEEKRKKEALDKLIEKDIDKLYGKVLHCQFKYPNLPLGELEEDVDITLSFNVKSKSGQCGNIDIRIFMEPRTLGYQYRVCDYTGHGRNITINFKYEPGVHHCDMITLGMVNFMKSAIDRLEICKIIALEKMHLTQLIKMVIKTIVSSAYEENSFVNDVLLIYHRDKILDISGKKLGSFINPDECDDAEG